MTEKRTALVTGASRGIGAAIARRLAADGFVVGVGYREREDAARAVVAAIAQAGGRASPVAIDVTDSESVRAAVKNFVGSAGGLDVLVANAGVTGAGLAVGTSDEELRRLLDVNVEGAFRCARAAIRPMFRRGGGRVVFLGSVVGVTGNAGQAAYATTKAALTGLARSLARELAAKNILVNVVAPGLVDTGPGGMIDALPPDRRALVLESIPLGRAASPDEIAGVISFLSGADAGYITGQVFLVDGGLRM